MPRTIGRLNALNVERAKRLGMKPGMYPDGAGLYLQVAQGSARSWIFRYMLDGRARQMGLGPLDAVTLAEARQKAHDARKLKAAGIDPVEQKHALRAGARLARAKLVTFAAVRLAQCRTRSPVVGDAGAIRVPGHRGIAGRGYRHPVGHERP
jgi:Arm DNA-binding domain